MAFPLPPPNIFNHELNHCWQALQGGRTVAVYRSLIDITGSLKAAVMLSQLLYWTKVSTEVAERDGWIYKTIAEMEHETGLTKREQQTCKDKLTQLGLIHTARNGFGAKLSFKVDLNAITQALDSDSTLNINDLNNRSSLFFRRHFSKRIAYHRDLVSITGCIHAAIMLSHVLRQSILTLNQTNHQHAFSSLSISDWQKHADLSYKNQYTARSKLKMLGLIQEKHFYASRRIFTLVNGSAILEAIASITQQQPKTSPKRPKINSLPKRANPVCRKGQFVEKQSLGKYSGGFGQHAYSQVCISMTFRSNKSENTEVTKGEIKKLQNRKFRSNKSVNCYIKDYKGFSNENNYNNENAVRGSNSETISSSDAVVVVPLDDLIYPKAFSQTMKQQAWKIIQQEWPQATQADAQNLLDEIAGQIKPVSSPLGFLVTLCRKAAQDELILLQAPRVQQIRMRRQQNQQLSDGTEPTTNKIPKEEAVKKLQELKNIIKRSHNPHT